MLAVDTSDCSFYAFPGSPRSSFFEVARELFFGDAAGEFLVEFFFGDLAGLTLATDGDLFSFVGGAGGGGTLISSSYSASKRLSSSCTASSCDERILKYCWIIDAVSRRFRGIFCSKTSTIFLLASSKDAILTAF